MSADAAQIARYSAALERGLAAFRDARFEQAAEDLGAALAALPDQPEALSLLGLALVRTGRIDEGGRQLARAVEREPAQPGLRFNLAEGLIVAKRYERAIQELQHVVDAVPGHAAAWARIGDVEELRGDEGAAADAWAKAFGLDATPQTAFKLGHLALRCGRAAQAHDFAFTTLQRHPREPALYALLCESLAALRDWPALEAAAAGWQRALPDANQPWRERSRAAFEQGRLREAVEHYARFLAAGRHGADDLATFAGLALHALDFDAAEAALGAAEELEPGHPEVLAKRALLDTYHGRFEAAESGCLRVLERQPDHVPVLTILSRLRHGRLGEADVERLEALVAQPEAHLDRRIPAAFAIGHAHDAADDADRAFAAYARAHALALERDAQEGRRYSAAAEVRLVERLMELFPGPGPLPAPEPRVHGPRPIFVVGAPRSGTTLVESVLGAHSRVMACGERSTMQQMLRALMDADARGVVPTDADLVQWTRTYLADLPPLGGRDHFTDKHPLNLAAVGLIARLFPDAAIVLVRRDPVETCLSIWRQEFSKYWQFVHRLEDLGTFYGQHARLAAHWERTLPGRVIPVRYEEFAADFANAAPALVRAVGLDWEPACAQLRDSPNAIATFSAVDVRDPVSVRNRRAALYAKHLGPLVDALRANGVEPPAVH